MEVVWRGSRITLSAADFVAEGGQAKVYTRQGKALKVFTSAPPPEAKLAALKGASTPGIVAPEDLITSTSGELLGFSMPMLPDWRPVVQLFPRSYRDREGLDVHAIEALVLQLRGLVEHAHAFGALIVDLNELNVLVEPAHTDLAVIDVDSWQLPGFPASALAPSVQDHRSSTFHTGSDWYAFAVLAFQLFSGIHPYRGRHPAVKTLEDRMKRCLSVYHPDVIVPPMAVLDVPWRAWFESVFSRGERCAPPTGFGSLQIPVLLPPRQARVDPALILDQPLRGVASWDGRGWAWTERGLYEGRRRIGPAPEKAHLPVRSGAQIGFIDATGFDQAQAHKGVVYARSGTHLVELEVRAFGVTQRRAATISPHATRLYRGIAVMAVLGSTWLLELSKGAVHTRRTPELDGLRVVDAVHTAGVSVVITRASSGYLRHVFGPDGHRTEPTSTPAAQLLVLPTGLAIVTTDDGLQLFQASRPCGSRRDVVVDLPAPLQLYDGRPGYIDGTRFMSISLS